MREFLPGSASDSLGPSAPTSRLPLPQPPLPRPPWPYLSPFPVASTPQVLSGFTEDLSGFPSLGPTLPLQSPPLSLTHTEPHALLISRCSQGGLSWCQGRQWAPQRGPVRTSACSWPALLRPPPPHYLLISICSVPCSLGGWYFSGPPRTGVIGDGQALGDTEHLRWAS